MRYITPSDPHQALVTGHLNTLASRERRIDASRHQGRIARPAGVCDHAHVNMTTTTQVDARGFWTSADAFGAWTGDLVEAIANLAPVLLDPALSAPADQWHVAAVVTDFGADAGEPSHEHRSAPRSNQVADPKHDSRPKIV